jgi:hypothetical protein
LKAFCLFKHLPLGDLTVISHRFFKNAVILKELPLPLPPFALRER